MILLTMIAPVGAPTQAAQNLCAGLAGPSGAGMFETELSPTGNLPATHTISSGPISVEFAALLPVKHVTTDTEGREVITATPGRAADVVALAASKGIAVTQSDIEALFAAIDVSDQESFPAQARLGLQIVRVPLP